MSTTWKEIVTYWSIGISRASGLVGGSGSSGIVSIAGRGGGGGGLSGLHGSGLFGALVAPPDGILLHYMSIVHERQEWITYTGPFLGPLLAPNLLLLRHRRRLLAAAAVLAKGLYVRWY